MIRSRTATPTWYARIHEHERRGEALHSATRKSQRAREVRDGGPEPERVEDRGAFSIHARITI